MEIASQRSAPLGACMDICIFDVKMQPKRGVQQDETVVKENIDLYLNRCLDFIRNNFLLISIKHLILVQPGFCRLRSVCQSLDNRKSSCRLSKKLW